MLRYYNMLELQKNISCHLIVVGNSSPCDIQTFFDIDKIEVNN